MSCVPVTPEMVELLEALQEWPDVDLEALRSRREWEQAREWGWAMESGELTETGLAHALELPRGIVSDWALGIACGLRGDLGIWSF